VVGSRLVYDPKRGTHECRAKLGNQLLEGIVPVPKPLSERAVDTMRRSSPMNELMELDGVVPFGLKPDSELGMEQNIGGPKTA